MCLMNKKFIHLRSKTIKESSLSDDEIFQRQTTYISLLFESESMAVQNLKIEALSGTDLSGDKKERPFNDKLIQTLKQ